MLRGHGLYTDFVQLAVYLGCEHFEDGVLCKFTESTARAHQLLATLLHELGSGKFKTGNSR